MSEKSEKTITIPQDIFESMLKDSTSILHNLYAVHGIDEKIPEIVKQEKLVIDSFALLIMNTS